LLELDAKGRIQMTLGAGPRPGGAPVDAWSGLRLVDLVGKSGQKPLADALAAIRPNERTAPIETLIVCDTDHVRRARLRLFQLPDLAPAVSCAISYEGAAFTLSVPEAPTLLSADGLLNRVRGSLATGLIDVAVAFVDIPGLDAPDEAHQRAAARVAAVLQASSVDGASAARLAPERYALVRPSDCQLDIEAEVRDAGLLPDWAQTQRFIAGLRAGPTTY
jgi:hypothetical protein